MRTSRGFTLVEILVVLAIIGIITAIAVPSLLGSKVSANEAAAIKDLRAAQADWAAVASYSPATNGCAAVSTSFSTAKSGYLRGCTAGVLWATPLEPGKTGVRGFGADITNRLCYTIDGSIPSMTGNCNTLK